MKNNPPSPAGASYRRKGQTMKMTISNSFHNTEIQAECFSTGEYQSGEKYAGEKYAEFTIDQLNSFGRELCGSKDCLCGKFGDMCEDENGNYYRIDLED